MGGREDEAGRLLELCDGGQRGAGLRQSCLAEKPARACRLPSISPALLRQLAGRGNNLNQIARKVNAVGAGHDRVQIVAALMATKCPLYTSNTADELSRDFSLARHLSASKKCVTP
ncbi:plasmid mobilization relaxosome protein MobC [Klebsiella pneumoniae]|nr:plasmid mobilization relaxosome protein MobC [Klebsiella pneumoniae]